MFGRKLGLVAVMALALGLVLAAPAAQARKKVITKTYEVGVGAPGGGFAIPARPGEVRHGEPVPRSPSKASTLAERSST